MVPCEADEEEDDFPWEDLDEDALAQYLDSLCGDMLNNDSWWYCGLLENLIACQDGDEEACDDLAEWLETADWSWWQGTDEEEGLQRAVHRHASLWGGLGFDCERVVCVPAGLQRGERLPLGLW